MAQTAASPQLLNNQHIIQTKGARTATNPPRSSKRPAGHGPHHVIGIFK